MASYARPCLCFFLLLVLSFSNQTQARESKFFSKFSRFLRNRNTKETTETITLSPTSLPTSASAPAPSPETEGIEHGYGLYGNEDTSYQYPPTTTDPVKTTSFASEEKYTPVEELTNNKFHVNGKQGMSDTRFLENGKYHYDVSQEGNGENTHFNEEMPHGKENRYEAEEHELVEDDDDDTFPENEVNENGNEYVGEKQGLSDTKFMENGQYYNDERSHVNEHGNGNEYEMMPKDEFQPESTRFDNGNGNEYEMMPKDEFHPENTRSENRNGKEYGNEKQGMSDTRFLQKGKYFYDLNAEVAKDADVHYNLNNNEEKHFDMEKQGLSDTRFLENGKYYYDVNQENGDANSKYNNENYKSTMNYEYANGYNDVNENERYDNNNGYVAGTRAGYRNNYGNTKKLPNTYDSIEEYEKEQEYKASQRAQNGYVP